MRDRLVWSWGDVTETYVSKKCVCNKYGNQGHFLYQSMTTWYFSRIRLDFLLTNCPVGNQCWWIMGSVSDVPPTKLTNVYWFYYRTLVNNHLVKINLWFVTGFENLVALSDLFKQYGVIVNTVRCILTQYGRFPSSCRNVSMLVCYSTAFGKQQFALRPQRRDRLSQLGWYCVNYKIFRFCCVCAVFLFKHNRARSVQPSISSLCMLSVVQKFMFVTTVVIFLPVFQLWTFALC